MKKIAICVMRNSYDIIAFSALNYVMMGVDNVFIVDNGSTDASSSVLQKISNKIGKIEVLYEPGEYNQSKFMNNIINSVIHEMKEVLVIPFDSDEFWNFDSSALLKYLESQSINCAKFAAVNFVQNSLIEKISRAEDLMPKWRVTSRRDVDYESIVSGRRSMIQARPKRKVVFVASSPVNIGFGQHHVDFDGKVEKKSDRYFCLHFPVRSGLEISKRVNDFAPRTFSDTAPKDRGWHMAALMESHQKFGEEALWRANSVRYGMLNINGRLWPCVPDLRLYRRIRDVVSFARAKGLNVEELYE
jgi:glycosyltransferase involved in cell wall biosynthesis